ALAVVPSDRATETPRMLNGFPWTGVPAQVATDDTSVGAGGGGGGGGSAAGYVHTPASGARSSLGLRGSGPVCVSTKKLKALGLPMSDAWIVSVHRPLPSVEGSCVTWGLEMLT